MYEIHNIHSLSTQWNCVYPTTLKPLNHRVILIFSLFNSLLQTRSLLPGNEGKNTPSLKSLPLVFYLTKQVHAFCIATIQLIDAFLPSCRGSRARICVVSGEFLPSFLHLKIRPVTTGNVEPMTKYFVRNVLQFGVVTIERRK